MNYFKILEISPPSNSEEVKKAYRRLAKIYHPDMNGDKEENIKKFHDISKAYDVLKDDSSRMQYINSQKPAVSNFTTKKNSSYNTNRSPQSDIYSSGIWRDFFYKKPSPKHNAEAPPKPIIANAEISISIKEAYSGGEFKVSTTIQDSYREQIKCPNCSGTGVYCPFGLDVYVCDMCDGRKWIYKDKSINERVKFTVKLPLFLTDNSIYYVNYKDIGRIAVKIRVKNTEDISLKGNDVYMTRTISRAKFTKGTTSTFTNIDGNKLKIKIPPKSSFDRTFKLSQRGFGPPGNRGDLYVKFKPS